MIEQRYHFTIGVVGCGVVGQAVHDGFITRGLKVVPYDKYKPGMALGSSLFKTEAIFVCVPTPTKDGAQDISALEETFKLLLDEKYLGVIVVKSTVLPGTCQALADKYLFNKVVHNPEFLTAAQPFGDFMAQSVILLGSKNIDAAVEVSEIYQMAGFSHIRITNSCLETEILKYARNNYLATKVSFFNEVLELCEKLGASYREVLTGLISIGGIEPTHTSVPGPDGKRGFGGMCFPKDTQAMLTFLKSLGLDCDVLEGVVAGNKRRRPELK